MAKTTLTLKTILKDSDPVEIPMHPEFYDKLHLRIMSEVKKVEMQPPRGRLRATPAKAWQSLLTGLKK